MKRLSGNHNEIILGCLLETSKKSNLQLLTYYSKGKDNQFPTPSISPLLHTSPTTHQSSQLINQPNLMFNSFTDWLIN